MATKTDVDHQENLAEVGLDNRTDTHSSHQHDPDKGTAGHANYHGIDTRAVSMGADEVYERKISIMNEALIDLGMGSFQWKVFAMTGFGWFVDNVSPSHFMPLDLYDLTSRHSSGCKPSPSSHHLCGPNSRSSALPFSVSPNMLVSSLGRASGP